MPNFINLFSLLFNLQFLFLQKISIYPMTSNAITQKYQLIDDESAFRIQQIQGLANQKIQSFGKQYHLVSVIGSQSSGKSTLLNAIFNTEFDTLNRRKRVGQTTKGIWYSIDMSSKIIILDVEGSDSTERQQRTKIQRRNSLFALAVSHTLLINLWVQQIGLHKGSQLAILQIILELNLKLFGSQKPKEIIFVVRDFIAETQNEEVLRQKLFAKVEEAWKNIPKPPGKQNIKLKDLFSLQAFFLPSKVEQKELFAVGVQKLRKYLIQNSKRKELTSENVLMKDFPRYMQNLWTTIEQDKDINLPQEKILLSSMRCHQIQKKIYTDFEEEFRDQLEKSERKLNEDFGKNIKAIVQKMIDTYNQETSEYIEEEAEKVKNTFLEFLEGKIELSFSFQVKMISEECLKEFVEDVNKHFMKEKSIDTIKEIKPRIIKKFQDFTAKVSYRPEWVETEVVKFTKSVEDSFEYQKEKIVSDSLKDFDRTIKKQIEGMISNAFYDKKIFCEKFWIHINQHFKEIEHKAKNSIVGLYNKLEIREKGQQSTSRRIATHVEKAKYNAEEELKTIIKMKCNDLSYYVMRHFTVDFTMDEQEIPRQWVEMKPEDILKLYETLKCKYLTLVDNFKRFNLEEVEDDNKDNLNSQKGKLKTASTFIDRTGNHDELLDSKELSGLNKKLEDHMKNLYEEACKKNKQVYSGSIPLWGWIIFLLVVIDDVFLWLHSPYLAIPLTLLLVAAVVIFVVGGKSAATGVLNTVKSQATSFIAGATTKAAASMMKKEN